MNMSLAPPCLSVLKMYKQRLNYQVFPMKTKCVEINGKEIKYLWVKENLIVP